MTRHLLWGILLHAGIVGAQGPVVQKDLTIGCESCGAALQFSSIFEVAVAPNGEMLVADRDAPLLRHYDVSGRPIWTGGVKGRGPGEYQLILRAGFNAAGGFLIADMTSMRVTELGTNHSVASTTPLSAFPTTAGFDGSGTMVMAAEGARGSLTVLKWRRGTVAPVNVELKDAAGANLDVRLASVAISPTGTLAILPHNERYVIIRTDSSGKRLPDLTRTVERVRNSQEEETALRERRRRASAMVAAEAKSAGGSGVAVPIPEGERTLKPHVAVDGLRYDSSGRLWVRTMRGDQSSTVFDVFSATGVFAGSVSIPQRVAAFSLGGRYLVTAGENADGIPQVTRWIVK